MEYGPRFGYSERDVVPISVVVTLQLFAAYVSAMIDVDVSHVPIRRQPYV